MRTPVSLLPSVLSTSDCDHVDRGIATSAGALLNMGTPLLRVALLFRGAS